jgi:peptidoglycan/xylan/chitin deacetylase (PgdA/CDA1 family)
LRVQSASLTQSAQQVVWKLRLTEPFSPAALASGRRSLCLLLERVGNGSVTGQLCVTGPRPGHRTPRIVYQRVTRAGPGRGKVIDASVSRSGASELTASFVPTGFGLSYRSLRWQVISTLRPPACTPAKPNRAGCLSLFPAQPALTRLHTPQLVGCVDSGAPFVTSGPTKGREIALTFDDGPWYDTPQFLDILEHYHVHATFFEIGDQISTYGEGGAIERRMLADGDMVGDHTWNHPDIAGGGAFAAGEITQAAAAIKQATHGFEPCLLRAPYGDVSSALFAVATRLGFKTIQWDIDPRDWALPGVGAIYSNVVDNAHPGAIVIQHDGGGNRSETIAALPQEIRTLRARGYEFVTITQMFGMKLIYR